MHRHLTIVWLSALGFSVFALPACTSRWERQQKENKAAIAARCSGDTYTFKVWPTAAETYEVRLAGVTHTSCHLGPDFTVHYFDFGESGSVGIYHGMHPQAETEAPTGRFRSSFAGQSARWSVFKTASGFRASAQVTEPEREDEPAYIWHLMVSAPTEKELHARADQLATFRRVPVH